MNGDKILFSDIEFEEQLLNVKAEEFPVALDGKMTEVVNAEIIRKKRLIKINSYLRYLFLAFFIISIVIIISVPVYREPRLILLGMKSVFSFTVLLAFYESIGSFTLLLFLFSGTLLFGEMALYARYKKILLAGRLASLSN